MTKSEFVEMASDYVEQFFPKGKTKMRGEAMILIAMIAKELLDKGLITDKDNYE
jgi:hypothetical protein